MKAVLIHSLILLLASLTLASTPQDDADTIHIRSRVQDLQLDDAAAGAEIRDISSKQQPLLALTGKDLQMPKAMRDPLLKRRAFHLCRSHGFANFEQKGMTAQMLAAVPFEKDFRIVQSVEGNLKTISAAEASHWSTSSEGGKHVVSGPFAVFSSLTCVR